VIFKAPTGFKSMAFVFVLQCSTNGTIGLNFHSFEAWETFFSVAFLQVWIVADKDIFRDRVEYIV